MSPEDDAPKEPPSPAVEPSSDDPEKEKAIGKLAKKDPPKRGEAALEIQAKLETLQKITGLLGELETSTWSAETPKQLNLQIVLRRSYETNVAAAAEANARGDEIAKAGQNVLRFAVGVAFFGWLGTIFCVVWHAVKGDPFVAASLWPALVATSGAVLLLVGVATITFRVAQRAHDRAMTHHDRAMRTRKLEAAVRLLTAFEGSAELMKATQEFAVKMLEGHEGSRPAQEELSALPEAVSSIAAKALDTAVAATKELGEIAKLRKGSE